MESGETPEQLRCGIRLRLPSLPILTSMRVKAGRRFEAGSPNTCLGLFSMNDRAEWVERDST